MTRITGGTGTSHLPTIRPTTGVTYDTGCAIDVFDVDGQIDHRDVILSDRQYRDGKRLRACVSRTARAGVPSAMAS